MTKWWNVCIVWSFQSSPMCCLLEHDIACKGQERRRPNKSECQDKVHLNTTNTVFGAPPCQSNPKIGGAIICTMTYLSGGHQSVKQHRVARACAVRFHEGASPVLLNPREHANQQLGSQGTSHTVRNVANCSKTSNARRVTITQCVATVANILAFKGSGKRLSKLSLRCLLCAGYL